jgi:FkbM family methyltransferase
MTSMPTARRLLRRVRRAARCAAGRDIWLARQIAEPAVRLGSEYGGWDVSPRGLGPDAVVYSAGIGTDISFDLALIEAYGVTVHAFDPTPASIAWVKSQPLPQRYHWHEIGLASYDGRATFFPPDDPQHISHTMVERASTRSRAIEVDVRRVSTLMGELGHRAIDLLKMDIEGAEYSVLEDVLANGPRIGQILVEFHHRFPGVGIEPTRRAVRALNAAGYRIFAVSETGEEYGFILSE